MVETAASRVKTERKQRGASGRTGNLGTWIFAFVVIGVLAWGWMRRNDGWLNAEVGLGYALGIGGAALMLALLSYPLRKRAKFMRRLGPVSFWFRLHMFLGIAGPVVILFHANFSGGSMNSSVALTAMLIVATSGLVGRYFHGRLHVGLYGRRSGTRDLVAQATFIREKLKEHCGLTSSLEQRMQALESAALKPRVRFTAAAWSALRITGNSGKLRKYVRRRIAMTSRRLAQEQGWPARRRRGFRRATNRMAADYFRTVEKAAQFALYERLFALWHLLHVPLFLILILTVILHVIAVHMY